MAKFLSELDVHLVDDDKIWELDFSLEYESDILKTKIIVPAGFQTDFASIPRWIPIASNYLLDKAHREAVIHDYLYRSNSIPLATRKQADEVLLEAMESRGKPFAVRWMIYEGVRLGGWTAYHKLCVQDCLKAD